MAGFNIINIGIDKKSLKYYIGIFTIWLFSNFFKSCDSWDWNNFENSNVVNLDLDSTKNIPCVEDTIDNLKKDTNFLRYYFNSNEYQKILGYSGQIISILENSNIFNEWNYKQNFISLLNDSDIDNKQKILKIFSDNFDKIQNNNIVWGFEFDVFISALNVSFFIEDGFVLDYNNFLQNSSMELLEISDITTVNLWEFNYINDFFPELSDLKLPLIKLKLPGEYLHFGWKTSWIFSIKLASWTEHQKWIISNEIWNLLSNRYFWSIGFESEIFSNLIEFYSYLQYPEDNDMGTWLYLFLNKEDKENRSIVIYYDAYWDSAVREMNNLSSDILDLIKKYDSNIYNQILQVNTSPNIISGGNSDIINNISLLFYRLFTNNLFCSEYKNILSERIQNIIQSNDKYIKISDSYNKSY